MAAADTPPPTGGMGFLGLLSFLRSATTVASFDPAQDDELLVLDAFQAHVSDRLAALSASAQGPLLSLTFLSKLLDVVGSSDAAFRRPRRRRALLGPRRPPRRRPARVPPRVPPRGPHRRLLPPCRRRRGRADTPPPAVRARAVPSPGCFPTPPASMTALQVQWAAPMTGGGALGNWENCGGRCGALLASDGCGGQGRWPGPRAEVEGEGRELGASAAAAAGASFTRRAGRRIAPAAEKDMEPRLPPPVSSLSSAPASPDSSSVSNPISSPGSTRQIFPFAYDSSPVAAPRLLQLLHYSSSLYQQAPLLLQHQQTPAQHPQMISFGDAQQQRQQQLEAAAASMIPPQYMAPDALPYWSEALNLSPRGVLGGVVPPALY